MIPLKIDFVSRSPLTETLWPDLTRDKIHHLADAGPPLGVAVLEKGMTSGKPSICLRIDLPDGKTVLVETSARLFCTAARAIMARYPTLFED